MSTQEELNAFPHEYILYYCHQTMQEPVIHKTDCSDVCTLSWHINTFDLQITNWLPAYAEPTSATLLLPSLVDVLAWFKRTYETPLDIASMQHYSISQTDLDQCRVDASMKGFLVYNSTAQKTQYCTGSAWVDLHP